MIEQLTALPRTYTRQSMSAAASPNNRVRLEGGANVLAAAQAAGVRRYLRQSVAFYAIPGPVANAAFTALVKGEAGIAEPKPVPTLRVFREDFLTAVKAAKQDKPRTVQFYTYSFDPLLKYEPLAEAHLTQWTDCRSGGHRLASGQQTWAGEQCVQFDPLPASRLLLVYRCDCASSQLM